MLKVEVDGYFVGKAWDIEQAEDLVEDYMKWLDSTGRLDMQLAVRGFAVVPYVFRDGDRIAYDGEAKIEKRRPAVGPVN